MSATKPVDPNTVTSPSEVMEGDALHVVVRESGKKNREIAGFILFLDADEQPESTSGREVMVLAAADEVYPLAHVGGEWFESVGSVVWA